eukprot:TRINITY_DN1487_c0_g1_i1.p2 TRINITY_DN1487_c0_g1~~TRINITY_DN1487_c0_g1_i1.p2  ORF type:complete len:198 (-),score=10.61 TRINITY_DN1487_c0_g1_i1:497-1090(-)
MQERSTIVIILFCVGIYIYIRLNSTAPSFNEQGLVSSRTCNYISSRNQIDCSIAGQNIQCSTKNQDNLQQLPKGFYRIGVSKNREQQPQNISWFHLFYLQNNLWWHYHNNVDNDHFPGKMQVFRCVERGLSNDILFFGEMSIVPENNECWNYLQNLLINSFEVKNFTAEECYNCFGGVCLNRTSDVDHKYLTTLQVW